MTKIRGYGRIFFFLFLFDLRLWDWNWTWGYSRPVFAHHGTSSHKPALQRPRWSHSSRSSVSVWQAFHEIQSGTNWSLNLSALTCPHKLFFYFYFIWIGVWVFTLFPKGQNLLFQNQIQQQAQSKDVPPRFSKKGQLNVDEVKDVWKTSDLLVTMQISRCTKYSSIDPPQKKIITCSLLVCQYRLAWDRLNRFCWTKTKCQSCSHRFPTWFLPALNLPAHPPLRLDRCWSSHNPPLQKYSQPRSSVH